MPPTLLCAYWLNAAMNVVCGRKKFGLFSTRLNRGGQFTDGMENRKLVWFFLCVYMWWKLAGFLHDVFDKKGFGIKQKIGCTLECEFFFPVCVFYLLRSISQWELCKNNDWISMCSRAGKTCYVYFFSRSTVYAVLLLIYGNYSRTMFSFFFLFLFVLSILFDFVLEWSISLGVYSRSKRNLCFYYVWQSSIQACFVDFFPLSLVYIFAYQGGKNKRVLYCVSNVHWCWWCWYCHWWICAVFCTLSLVIAALRRFYCCCYYCCYSINRCFFLLQSKISSYVITPRMHMPKYCLDFFYFLFPLHVLSGFR